LNGDRSETTLRRQMVQAMQRLDALGLNRGSTGNLSQRCARGGRPGMLITPTGMGTEAHAQDMVPGAGRLAALVGVVVPSGGAGAPARCDGHRP
jgi:L-fuculose-phosphate aldolase